jgi:hypothetical protein
VTGAVTGSVDALPLPTFLTAWTTPAGTVRASPALRVLDTGLPEPGSISAAGARPAA